MDKLQEILDYSLGSFTVGKILAAVISFVVCYLVIKILMKFTNRLLSKTTLDQSVLKVIRSVVKVILYFITAIIVVDALGISATSLVAAFSVIGLAASLAVQDSLSNLASGITLLVSKPFKSGDYVDIDDVSGTIVSISLVHTKLVTIDNKMIFVPNNKIASTKIVNYTSQEKRRVDVEISASYDAPIETVRRALIDAVDDTGLFLETPQKPFSAVISYDESSVKYIVRAWTNTDDYWDAKFKLLENIKKEFDNNNIEMTYNHLNVHMINK